MLWNSTVIHMSFCKCSIYGFIYYNDGHVNSWTTFCQVWDQYTWIDVMNPVEDTKQKSQRLKTVRPRNPVQLLMCHSEVQSFTPAPPVCTRAKISRVVTWGRVAAHSQKRLRVFSGRYKTRVSQITSSIQHDEASTFQVVWTEEQWNDSWQSVKARSLCLGVTDVTAVCNSAPRLLLGHSHLLTDGAAATQTHQLVVLCAHFAPSPLVFPLGCLAARTPRLVCVA